jgi:ribosome maturation factor RimP
MHLESVQKLIGDFVKGTDIFLVEVKITLGKVLVTIDKPTGITIEECAALSRYLYQQLEGNSIFEKHELEVGSPGMEQPLKVFKQYLRRIGRNVKVVTIAGAVHGGILKHADENRLELLEIITEKEGKKKIKKELLTSLSFAEIKETRLELKFNK